MSKRLSLLFATLILLASFVSAGPPQKAVAAGCQYFSETGFQVCGRFLEYWQSHGGLLRQGFPISNEFDEQNSAPPAGDGQVHHVQYFQRARFEFHPENTAPNDILLGLLGAEQYTAKYGTPVKGPSDKKILCKDFDETGYGICGLFLIYWEANGGLAQWGYPISGVIEEANQPPPAGDGKVHKVQYFQRGRFEEHLDLAEAFKTLLGLLGAEQFKAKYGSNPPATAPTPTPTNQPSQPTPTPTAKPLPTATPTSKPVPTSTPAPTPTPTQPPVQQPSGGVQFVSVQGGRPGQYASVTVQTSANAYCTIDYYTPKGTHSVAQGLDPKNANSSGQVSWSWKIGTNTTPGTGEVDVVCGGVKGSSSITIE